MQLIKWPWLIGIAIVIGLVTGFMGEDPGMANERVSLKPLVWVLSVAAVIQIINLAYTVYVVKYMKNYAKIEKALKQAENPYFRMIYYMVNGDLEKAAREQEKVKGKQMQLTTKVQIDLESRDIAKAESIVDQIRHPNPGPYFKALIAIYKNDWDDFEAQKALLKQQVLIHALEAEAAFRRGEHDQAEKYGDLAIEGANGLQRYILMKSRERKKGSPMRETYF
ncbi:hypothetical protein ACE41H_13095 [Paenibacillus enshidis]|uniref:Uncharacterized protein n=1 Tax=Paenibacillus enshidis TaxID=1458439 RepID=A0ABV5AU11_9BACL